MPHNRPADLILETLHQLRTRLRQSITTPRTLIHDPLGEQPPISPGEIDEHSSPGGNLPPVRPDPRPRVPGTVGGSGTGGGGIVTPPGTLPAPPSSGGTGSGGTSTPTSGGNVTPSRVSAIHSSASSSPQTVKANGVDFFTVRATIRDHVRRPLAGIDVSFKTRLGWADEPASSGVFSFTHPRGTTGPDGVLETFVRSTIYERPETPIDDANGTVIDVYARDPEATSTLNLPGARGLRTSAQTYILFVRP